MGVSFTQYVVVLVAVCGVESCPVLLLFLFLSLSLLLGCRGFILIVPTRILKSTSFHCHPTFPPPSSYCLQSVVIPEMVPSHLDCQQPAIIHHNLWLSVCLTQ